MNESLSFTPGPWVMYPPEDEAITFEDYHTIRGGDGYHINSLNGGFCLSGFMSKHDARLISTAPNLLQALRALESAFMSHTQWDGDPPAEILQARAAIAMATGKTSEVA